jgi:hypothetical protein
VIVLFP